MRIKGAVLREPNRPYSIEELELEPPKEKEVLVRYAYTGYSPADQTTNLPLQTLPFHNKSILGNNYGMIATHLDIPRLVQTAMTHDLKLDKLVTNKFKLEEINDVADKMLKRQIRGRWVCAWE
jgi:Zn-dependent alcohol dehydrogenase